MAIGPVHNKDRVELQPPTSLPLMADVRVEDIGAESASGSLVELSSYGSNEYEQMQIAMKSVFIGYDISFRKLLEAMEQPSRILATVCTL